MAMANRPRKVSRSHTSTRRVRSGIAPFSQAQAALIKVAIHRINAFFKTFGRMPKETEPLLFVEGLTVPVFAPEAIAIEQLKQAANTCGVDLNLIRDFFDH
jgi:hypothetical protein